MRKAGRRRVRSSSDLATPSRMKAMLADLDKLGPADEAAASDGRQVAAGSSGSSAEPGGGIAPGGTEVAAARRARRARITLTSTT